MSVHLNEQQLAEWLLGSADAAVAGHIELCSACRHEADSLERQLALFRDSVHAAATRDEFAWMRQRAAIAQALRPSPSFTSLRWALAGSLCAALLATVMITQAPEPAALAPVHTSAADAADDALLLQIQSDLARPVPAALQPAQVIANERSARLQASAGGLGGNPVRSNRANHED